MSALVNNLKGVSSRINAAKNYLSIRKNLGGALWSIPHFSDSPIHQAATNTTLITPNIGRLRHPRYPPLPEGRGLPRNLINDFSI
jgi:hypothetical protein